MDYERICRLRTRDGETPLIIAGVSVTRTLPFGTPAQVRDELRWLVEAGPRRGLFLAASSSIAPGTPLANIRALIEGLAYYRRRRCSADPARAHYVVTRSPSARQPGSRPWTPRTRRRRQTPWCCSTAKT